MQSHFHQPGASLQTPVPIFQHMGEFQRLLDLYKTLKPLTTLEIGTYYGGTLYHWLQNAPVGALVVSVDSYATGIDNREQYRSWCPNLVRLVVVDGNSHDTETINTVDQYQPFDFVFIDGGHYYDEVRQDWENYSPMVDTGGVVAFHDILTSAHHPEIEVRKLWDEIKLTHDTDEFVQDPEAIWGGIGVAYL